MSTAGVNSLCIYYDKLPGVPIVILGDTNTVLPESVYLKDKWYTQKPFNKRSFLLYEFTMYVN